MICHFIRIKSLTQRVNLIPIAKNSKYLIRLNHKHLLWRIRRRSTIGSRITSHGHRIREDLVRGGWAFSFLGRVVRDTRGYGVRTHPLQVV